jgi:hypothetical protein
MKNRALDHKDDWITPGKDYLIWKARWKFSDFDPCPICAKGTRFNGLDVNWVDRTFVNPPYSQRGKKEFIDKAISQDIATCFLIPVSTSTVLFHETIQPASSKIIFLKGRLKFEGISEAKDGTLQWVNKGIGRVPHPLGTKDMLVVTNSGQHDSMLVFFGNWS